MLHLIIKLALIIAVICLVPITLICAQSYDDSELRAFLTPPEGCPAPCFMGIRPGVTTAEEAIAILNNSDWIRGNPQLNTQLSTHWPWSNQRSPWIDAQVDGALQVVDDKVDYLTIRTQLRVGDIMALLGQPDDKQFIPWAILYGPGSAYQYSAWYGETGLEIVTTSARCPINHRLFQSKTVIRVRSTPPKWQPDLGRPPCPT